MTIEEFFGTKYEFDKCMNIIKNHRDIFKEHQNNCTKLQTVKLLKELSGIGLKECKQMCDLYWDGRLPNFLIADRKEKLERLAKIPLVKELIFKIKNIESDELISILSKLSIDELLNIDELFTEE